MASPANRHQHSLKTLPSVPVIDIAQLLHQLRAAASRGDSSAEITRASLERDSENVHVVLHELSQACREWGFFYVKGHGLDDKLLQRLRDVSKEFFLQPKEYKKQLSRSEDNSRGYYDKELTKQKVDWKEVFDYGFEKAKQAAGDGENRWPSDRPEFKETLIEYFDAVSGVARLLLTALLVNLGVAQDFVDKNFGDSHHTSFLRLNHYPVCDAPKDNLGVSHHTDAGGLTLILQDDHVSSLQVLHNGSYHDVPPIPGTLVANIGDMMQVWSNDEYQAPVHRVIAQPLVDRFSFPFFYNPANFCDVEPLPQFVTPTNSARYRPINWNEFRSKRTAGDYRDLGEEVQISHYRLK